MCKLLKCFVDIQLIQPTAWLIYYNKGFILVSSKLKWTCNYGGVVILSRRKLSAFALVSRPLMLGMWTTVYFSLIKNKVLLKMKWSRSRFRYRYYYYYWPAIVLFWCKFRRFFAWSRSADNGSNGLMSGKLPSFMTLSNPRHFVHEIMIGKKRRLKGMTGQF